MQEKVSLKLSRIFPRVRRAGLGHDNFSLSGIVEIDQKKHFNLSIVMKIVIPRPEVCGEHDVPKGCFFRFQNCGDQSYAVLVL